MALADYYDRAALAAAQVIAGFDEHRFRQALEASVVGLSVDASASLLTEGRHLTDLVARLMARLYPRIQLVVSDAARHREIVELVRSINPNVELVESEATAGIAVGMEARPFAMTIFAGSDGWLANVGINAPLGVGPSQNPFGAGVAACLAAANLFRYIFLGRSDESLDQEISFSAWSGDRNDLDGAPPDHQDRIELSGDVVLVGLGAIGQAVLWALGRSALAGRVRLVDPQQLEMSNLQRYVCAGRKDVGRTKTSIAEEALSAGSLQALAHSMEWADFVAQEGYDWPLVLAAVDNARDRRAIQAALPAWVANAWTQPGDLGVSVHSRFGDAGACLWCLYLPSGPVPNEDELVASALKVPERRQEISKLLHHDTPVPAELLEAIAVGLAVPRDRLDPFEGATIRELYVEGLCGGAVVGLGTLSSPPQDVHVPLAHQSAFAGVLLAAALVRHELNGTDDMTRVTGVDVLRNLGVHLSRRVAWHDPRCICRDPDYVTAFRRKWPVSNVHEPS